MELIGYFCAALVGVSLGLLGSGGSILTLPILVYLMHINPVEATGFSLFIVGVTSAVGGISYVRKKLVDVRTAFIFAIPSILSVFITRKLLLPLIPDPVFPGPAFMLSKDMLILIVFSILMIVVGINMIRHAEKKEVDQSTQLHYNPVLLITVGLISGVLTGLLGVGGGFIIIPALVLFAKVPVHMSVGTSLLIIAVNSLSGFVEEALAGHASFNYSILLLFSCCAVVGIFIGFKISLRLMPYQLKRVFGWFISLLGVSIFINEFFLTNHLVK